MDFFINSKTWSVFMECSSFTNLSWDTSTDHITDQTNNPSVKSEISFLDKIKNTWHNFKEYSQKKLANFKSKTTIPKPGSLLNLNNTCYMNAVIQLLASSEHFIVILNEMNKECTNNLSLISLLDVLNGVNEEDGLNENLYRNTERLKNLIETIHWTKSSEQDSFDLLTEIIYNINHNSSNQQNIENPLRLKLVHTFQGFGIPSRIQEYLGLSLNLYKNIEDQSQVNLEYLIGQHFEPSNIDGDSSKMIKLNLYEKPPYVLLIHIQANKFDEIQRKMIKPKYDIIYEERMTLWLDIVTNINEDIFSQYEIQYDLKAVLHHIGKIDEGHYVTYRKWKGKWYFMNDHFVKEIEFTRDISPYIMLYELNSIKINT